MPTTLRGEYEVLARAYLDSLVVAPDKLSVVEV